MNLLIALLIAYLLGSLSFSILITRWLKLPDPRNLGSKNAGATNVARLSNYKTAAYVLLGDLLKGWLAVMIGRLLNLHGFELALIALAAVIGHIFPLYFKFKGGKGVATGAGVLLGLVFWVALVAMAIWIIVIVIGRYVSLASLIAAIAAPILVVLFGYFEYFFPVLAISALIIWKHWENMQRLRQGTEDKVQF